MSAVQLTSERSVPAAGATGLVIEWPPPALWREERDDAGRSGRAGPRADDGGRRALPARRGAHLRRSHAARAAARRRGGGARALQLLFPDRHLHTAEPAAERDPLAAAPLGGLVAHQLRERVLP